MRAVVEALGIWGQRWVEAQLSLKNLDPSLLMWDMRRNLDPSPLPDRRSRDPVPVQGYRFPSAIGGWSSSPSCEVDLCWSDPGFDVDLYVSTDLRTMTAIWMGVDPFAPPAPTVAFS